MNPTVGQIESCMNMLAPFDTAEDFDNVGLLLGRRDTPVTAVLVALDATLAVAEEARRLGAQLIVTHHPLFFHARRNLVEEDLEAQTVCRLVRDGIALISAHTNLDQTALSGSAFAARALGLENIRQEKYLFLGDVPAPEEAASLARRAGEVLAAPIRIYGDSSRTVRTLAIAGGAYDEGYVRARELGAQALLTGEVRHHNALAAAMEGFVLMDGTHYGTERILVPPLAASLQKALSALQYTVTVCPSTAALFAGGVD